MSQSWKNDPANNLPFSGDAVEAFIKATFGTKFGYITIPHAKQQDGFYHIWCFATEADYDSYVENPTTHASKLLQDIAIPISTEHGVTYSARLVCSETVSNQIVSVEKRHLTGLRFSSIQNDNGTLINAGISGILTFQRSVDGGSTWETVGTDSITSRETNDTVYDTFDIGKYFSNTNPQQIRVRASFAVTDEEGNILSTATSAWITWSNIIYTTLTLEFALDYSTPIDATQVTALPLAYILTGSVARQLHVSIVGSRGTYTKTFNIGANEYTSELQTWRGQADDDSDIYGLLTAGVKTIEAWLTCSAGGSGGTIESAHVVNQVVVDAGTAIDPEVLIQNLRTSVQNYVPVQFFSWSVYAPGRETVPVRFKLTDYNGNEVYMDETILAVPGTSYAQNATVEIEDSVNDTLYAYLSVIVDGVQSGSRTAITVDNSDKFAPTGGADWVLNPKTRNNSAKNSGGTDNVETIDGVTATFEGLSWLTDGWLEAEDGQRVLRLLAGQKVTFGYDWLDSFNGNPNSNVTLELDLKVRNITDEDTPCITALENYASAAGYIGLKMKPLVGAVMTATKVTEESQDFRWQEDERVRIAINIVSQLRAGAAGGSAMPLCRVFINGVINREFVFETEAGQWWRNGGNIVIGQHAADIDIYGIRVYKGNNGALTSADVLNDYVATLPTAQEKNDFRSANAILGPNSLVSADLCKQKGVNVLIWHGVQPYHELTAKQSGWWEIHVYDESGHEIPEHSGNICQETKSLKASRQGSTANTYYYSNIQTKLKDVTDTILVAIDKIHQDVTGWTESEEHPGYAEVVDGWIDGNGMYRGAQYQSVPGVPYATKLVGKINYASSMQSHLMGSCRLYNDLHRAVVGATSIQQQNSKARVAKYQELFLYFTQADNEPAPVFQGPMTFGAGKMDDPTWGYKKNDHAMFCMIEGADNNLPLTDMRVPWQSNRITVEEEDGEVAGWVYNGAVNLDLDRCKTVTRDFAVLDANMQRTTKSLKGPSVAVEAKIKEFINFFYRHNPRIKVWVGPWTGSGGFMASDQQTSARDWLWWCTAGDDAYKLRRYDFVDQLWVEAGWDEENELPEVRNLSTEFPDDVAANPGEWEDMNAAFIASIAKHARENAADIINVDSLKFHYAFTQQLIAGSDNCSKNTYYTLDPTTLKWFFSQDDMDTIFATDNSGFQTKPYYIDRQNPCAEGSQVALYEGGANALFNACEAMYEGTGEIRETFKSIFTAMSSLASSTENIPWVDSADRPTPWGCIWKYFFSIQKRIPAVAYNETARIRYEGPESIGFVSDRGVRPISQSMGDQLQSELQYMKRRLVMLASYAEWGNFSVSSGSSGNIGLPDASALLGIEATTDVAGNSSEIQFIGLVPHQYLWPGGRVGQTNKALRQRCKPGVAVNFDLTGGTPVQGDTACALYGTNYYRSLGNLGNISVKDSRECQITAKRLTNLIISPTDSTKPNFRPTSLVLNAPLLESINLNGSSRIGGTLRLTDCVRLASVDIRGCASINGIVLPESRLLTSVQLGSGLTDLSVGNQPNLATLTLEGATLLESLRIVAPAAGNISSLAIIQQCYEDEAPLTGGVRIDGVDWTLSGAGMVTWLASLSADLRGHIDITGNNRVTFATKQAYIDAWGDVDDSTNDLYITYVDINLASVKIYGKHYLDATGNYPLQLIPNSQYANNFKSIAWSISANAYATINAKTGVVSVQNVSTEDVGPTATVTVQVTLTSGTVRSATFEVAFYEHMPQVGDLVYANGQVLDYYDDAMTPIMQVTWVDPNNPRHGVGAALTVLASHYWGLYNNASNGVAGVTLEDTEYSAYNNPFLTNKTTRGVSYTTEAGYLDENQPDGFAVFSGNDVLAEIGNTEVTQALYEQHSQYFDDLHIAVGDMVPWGLVNTIKIIHHRDIVMTDSAVDMAALVPMIVGNKTEMQVLLDNMAAVAAESGAKYQQFFFPAASLCHAYEPTVKAGEVLADKFKAHHWFLPAEGELARFVWHNMNGSFQMAVNAGIYTVTTAFHWSSTENSEGGAWGVSASYGNVGGTGKGGQGSVRAWAAF